MRLFLAAILVALPACASGLTLLQYDAELARWSEQIARLEKNPREAVQLRKNLPPAWIVEDAGQRWESPTGWLDAALGNVEKDSAAARTQIPVMQARLAALRAAVAPLGTRAPDDSDSRRKLSAILTRPEFHPQEGWYDRLKRKIGEWIDTALEWVYKALDWLSRRIRMPRMPDVSPPFLVILTVALLLAAIYFFSRRLLFRPDRTVVPAAPVAAQSRRTWLDFGRRAAQAEEAGDHREAIRLAYWAGIYRLEELGVWRAESTRTHREYLRMIPSEAAQRAPLTAITQRFELSWYGGQPASADEYHDVANHLEEMGCQLPSNLTTANS